MAAIDSPAARLRDLEARGVVFRLEGERVTFNRIESWMLRVDTHSFVAAHHDWLRTVLELGPRLRAVRWAVERERITDR